MSHRISATACRSFWVCWCRVSVLQSPLSPPPVSLLLLCAASPRPPSVPPFCPPPLVSVCLPPPHPLPSTPYLLHSSAGGLLGWLPRRTKPGRGLPAHGCCLDPHSSHRCSRGTEVSVRPRCVRALMTTRSPRLRRARLKSIARNLDPLFIFLLTGTADVRRLRRQRREREPLSWPLSAQRCHGNSFQTCRMKDPHFVELGSPVMFGAAFREF